MEIQVTYLPVADLVPYARNARTHSDDQVDQIARSIDAFGFINPVIVDDEGGIIAGHGRLLAAEQLGLDRVPTINAGHLSEEQKRAYILADNKLALNAGWDEHLLAIELGELSSLDDFDVTLTGFSLDEIGSMLLGDKNTGKTDPDEIPDAPETPVTRVGDIWMMGDHRLICGDCTDADTVSRLMCDRQATAVFTSPPYGVGVDYDTYDDSFDHLRAMIPKLSVTWLGLLVDGGYAVVNFGDIVSARAIAGTDEPCEYPMAIEYWPVFRCDGWLLWSRRIWCKPSAGTGSMQCISSNRASTNWEHVWTWKKPGPNLHKKQTTGDYASQNGWIDSTHSHKLEIGLKDHGAGMPVMVAEHAVAVHTFTGDTVHEPFCGTGTTLIACEVMGRVCFASEISTKYCDITIQRWQDFTGQQAVREDGTLFDDLRAE